MSTVDAPHLLQYLLDDRRPIVVLWQRVTQHLNGSRNSRQRILDFMGQAGSHFAHRRELLGMGELLLQLAQLPHVFLNGPAADTFPDLFTRVFPSDQDRDLVPGFGSDRT